MKQWEYETEREKDRGGDGEEREMERERYCLALEGGNGMESRSGGACHSSVHSQIARRGGSAGIKNARSDREGRGTWEGL